MERCLRIVASFVFRPTPRINLGAFFKWGNQSVSLDTA